MKTKQQTQPTIDQIAGGLIITVSEARKILGADAKELREEELITLIYELGEMARAVLNVTLSSGTK
jgi:hypothetical protein